MNCFIDDYGIEALVANITKQAQTYHGLQSSSNGALTLALVRNEYTHRGVKALTNLITLNNVPLVYLWVQCGDFSSLKTLIEAFSSPTAVNCRRLRVMDSDLTSRHVYHLILLITQAKYLQQFDSSGNPGLHEVVPLILSAARNLKYIVFSHIPIDNQQLLEMAQVLQSNTSLTHLCIDSSSKMRYTFDSLIKFVEIVTAPESKSRLELLNFGEYKKNNGSIIVWLSYKLSLMAASRGHKLVVRPACLDTDIFSLGMEQRIKAESMPDWLVYGKV